MNRFFDLTGKVAIITGGGSGIGRSIATILSNHGASVFILDLNLDNSNKVINEILASGGNAKAIECNIADQKSVESAFRSSIIGKSIDILVNNAGIAHVGDIMSTTPEDLDKIYQVNVKGVYHCLKAGVAQMKMNGGSIVNISSVAAHVGISDRFAYSMSKGAVHAMTLSISKDYLKYNIRCNSVSPGRVHTPFVDGFLAKNYPEKEKEMFEKLSKSQPIGRMGKPEEIGALVLYLCSDEASFITGSDFPIDGGFIKLNN